MSELNGMEVLMGFLGWLTSRRKPVTFSSFHDATLAVRLAELFAQANNLGDVGPDWPDCVVYPAEEEKRANTP